MYGDPPISVVIKKMNLKSPEAKLSILTLFYFCVVYKVHCSYEWLYLEAKVS